MKTHTTINEIYRGGEPGVSGFDGHAWIETEGVIRDYPDETLLGVMGGRKGEIVRKPFPVELQKEVLKVEWKRYKKSLKWNREMNPSVNPKEVDDAWGRLYISGGRAGFCASRAFTIMKLCKKQKINYKIVFGSCGVQQGKNVWWEWG